MILVLSIYDTYEWSDADIDIHTFYFLHSFLHVSPEKTKTKKKKINRTCKTSLFFLQIENKVCGGGGLSRVSRVTAIKEFISLIS